MRFTRTVLKFRDTPDKQGDIITNKTEVKFTDVVPVTLDFKLDESAIGFARLRKTKTGITASIKLFDKKIKVKANKNGLYPAIGGTVVKSNGHKLQSIIIREVALTPSRNVDYTIRPIKISVERIKNA